MSTIFASCGLCQTKIGWVDCPTGGWWAHEMHPADGHDAVPSADLVTVQVRADEAAELGEDRCTDPKCGHLLALHNTHCCQFCTVTNCPCEP